MKLTSDPNFEDNLTFYLKNDMRNLVNFNTSSGKSKNSVFDGLFLSKVCNVLAKKVQRICYMTYDLWFQKLHKHFGEFSSK